MSKSISQDRTNEYLEDQLYEIWEENFNDVPRKNLVLIHFGRYSKRRLGSIKWATNRTRIKGLLRSKKEIHSVQDDKRISVITLTRYYSHKEIPEKVVRMTIAHEMVHYAHGFHSPLPKLFEYPHQGNIVNKELIKRGMGKELDQAEKWLNENWAKFTRTFKK